MKRHSITAIVDKAQSLSVKARQYFESPSYRYVKNYSSITRAAVNEIINLQVEDKYAESVQAKIDKVLMKEETDKFLNAVGIICKDYNDKILKP